MNEFIMNQIKEFWLERWEYITLPDAILEAREAGYTEPRIKDLKALYNSIEEYQC